MGYEFDGNLRDLALRQNREVTTAQKDVMEKTKRVSAKDLDDFVKDTKNKSFILNSSDPKKALWDYEEHKLCNLLSGNTAIYEIPSIVPIIRDPRTNNSKEVVVSSKSSKSTIVKMNLLDIAREKDPQKITIKYPAGLLDEFILEYQKIVVWLEENKYDALTLLRAEDEIHISQHEFEGAIRFLEKMKLVSEES